MSKFKKGDKVEVIGNHRECTHYFDIGDIVEIISVNGNGGYSCLGESKYGYPLNQTVYEQNLAPFKEKEVASKVTYLKPNSLAQFIRIGDVVIAVPKGITIGIATCHDDDKFCEDCGRGIAFERLIENSSDLF